jgi:hypothetical protein
MCIMHLNFAFRFLNVSKTHGGALNTVLWKPLLIRLTFIAFITTLIGLGFVTSLLSYCLAREVFEKRDLLSYSFM